MSGAAVATTAPGSAYSALKPVLQRFVDGISAGEKPAHVVARLRPRLKSPQVLAWKWQMRPDVKAARAELAEMAFESVGITQQMIVKELGRIGFGDPRKLADADGNPLPLHKLDDDTVAMVAGVEIIESTNDDGKVTSRVKKIRRWDKRQALRDLAEMKGMKTSTTGGGTIFNVQINL